MHKKMTIVVLFSLVLLGFASIFFVQKYLDTPLRIETGGMEYSLPKGSSLTRMAYALSNNQVLIFPRVLIIYSRLTGVGANIKTGEYFFDEGITVRQMLHKLEMGEVKYYQVTLVEGWTLSQAFSELTKQTKLKKQLGESWKETLMQLLQKDDPAITALEGLFFPDTYRYHAGMSDKDILLAAHASLQAVLKDEWDGRSRSLPYKNAYEALIMASIIEKETGAAHERAEIAGVFVRRLQKGMRLQTDPSVIYGLGEKYKGNLRSRHLTDKSNPFNSYRHHGLPPTPIALVGREAIHAAFHPAEGEFLYFVAKGDGSHYFSSTLEEHQKAVYKYQVKERKKNYSSAPAQKNLPIN